MSTTRDFYVVLEKLVRLGAVDTLRYFNELAQTMISDLESDNTARRLLAEALPDWDFDDPEVTK